MIGEHDDALSDARSGFSQVEAARLAKLIDVWPALGDDVKGAILSLAGQRPDDVDDWNDVAGRKLRLDGFGGL